MDIDPEDVENLVEVLGKMKYVKTTSRTPVKITPLVTRFRGELSGKSKEKIELTITPEGTKYSKRQQAFMEAMHDSSKEKSVVEGPDCVAEGPDVRSVPDEVTEPSAQVKKSKKHAKKQKLLVAETVGEISIEKLTEEIEHQKVLGKKKKREKEHMKLKVSEPDLGGVLPEKPE